MVTGIAAASNTNVKFMRILTVIGSILTSSCCVPMSKLVDPRLRIAPAAAAPQYELRAAMAIVELSEIWRDAARQRDVPVRLYRPATASGRLPVVVFSHGIGEDRDSYTWLGRALASRGFLAVHLTHQGTDKAVLRSGYWNLYKATKVKENWVNRPLDVTFALDRIAARDDADMSRVAVAGHSAGAFTALAVAGMKMINGATFTDPRVRVAIAMSMPKMNGVAAADGYSVLRIPVLHLTGTCDTSLVYRTQPRDRRVPFESSSAGDQYLVTIERVNHDAFSNPEDAAHPLIERMTIAFLDAFLLGAPAARAWLDDGGPAAAGGVAVERKSMR
ncbi:MAG: alpha/beta hydrolase family protein [Thermoanaerobaculia bacterium]